MLYKDFEGEQLSSLGFGAMRLPVVDGDNAKIDQDAVNEMVDYALDRGVNYFDTAWGYHDGQSEIAMGIALNRHARDEFMIATKFPGYDVNNMDKVEEIFEKQLEKTGMEFFDSTSSTMSARRISMSTSTPSSASWTTCSSRRRPVASVI